MQSQKFDPKSISPHSLTRLVYCRTWFQAAPTNHHDRAHHARQTSILARRSLRRQHNKYLAGLFVALSLLILCLLEARYIQPLQKYTLFDSVIPQFTSARSSLCMASCGIDSILGMVTLSPGDLVFGAGVMTTDEQRAICIAYIPSLEVFVDPMCYGRDYYV